MNKMADKSRRRLMTDEKERCRIREEQKELKDVKKRVNNILKVNGDAFFCFRQGRSSKIIDTDHKSSDSEDFSYLKEEDRVAAFVKGYRKKWLVQRYENGREIEKLYGNETRCSYYLGGLGMTLKEASKVNFMKILERCFFQGLLQSK